MNTRAEQPALLTRRDRTMLAITVVATAAAGVLYFAGVNAVVAFVVAALALATLASLVGRSVEALGDRLGPNAAGIVQTALGNLPELFVIMFALKAGLFGVVKATIVGKRDGDPVEHPRASSPIVASPDSANAASSATAHVEWPLVMAIEPHRRSIGTHRNSASEIERARSLLTNDVNRGAVCACRDRRRCGCRLRVG